MGHLTLSIDSSKSAKIPIHSYGWDGDLTMKLCPRGGTFDFENSQIC